MTDLTYPLDIVDSKCHKQKISLTVGNLDELEIDTVPESFPWMTILTVFDTVSSSIDSALNGTF